MPGKEVLWQSARPVWDIHHLYELHVNGDAFEAHSLFKTAYSTTTVQIKTALTLMGLGCAANSDKRTIISMANVLARGPSLEKPCANQVSRLPPATMCQGHWSKRFGGL